MVTDVNWKRLGEAVEFYKSYGFQYIEVPWMVSNDAIDITFPKHIVKTDAFDTKYGTLVGSAEQSFLELDVIQNKFGKGRFVACTPCFRDETTDLLHQKYFMKVELYVNEEPTVQKLRYLIENSKLFFSRYTDKVVETNTIEGFDLELNKIEIGSYGIRKYRDHEWIYGTGLAEPRFSIALGEV